MKNFLKTILACSIGTFFGFSLLIFFGLIFLTALARLSLSDIDDRDSKNKHVLFLPLKGEIVEHKGSFFWEWKEDSPFFQGPRKLGLFEIQESLRKAKNDKNIHGVYLKIGHLQSGWASAEAIHRALLDFKSSGKFIQAYGENFSEKTYYIASASDKIHIYPEGSFELNGIAAIPLFAKGALEKLGIHPEVFRVGEFKSAVEIFTKDKMSEENRYQTRKLIGSIWSHFVQEVRIHRKIDPQIFNQLASNLKVLRASDALEKGLVDEPSSEKQVIDLLKTLVGTSKDDQSPLIHFDQYFHQQKMPFALKNKPRIAVIFAMGEIISGNSTNQFIGSETIVRALRDIEKEKDVKALVLRVNSPGGNALAADVIWRQTMELKKTKPVIASFGDLATSGGYYISAGADHIFTEAKTLTGSIGIFGLFFNTQKFFNDKLGITFDRVLTHPYSDLGNSNRKMTNFERARIQSEINKTYTQFLRVVKQGRNFQTNKEIERLARGRIWSGTQAQQVGLVDEQGGLMEALKKAAEISQLGDNWEIEIFPHEKNPFEKFIRTLGEITLMKTFKRSPLSNNQFFEKHLPTLKRLKNWQQMGRVLALDPYLMIID